MDGVLASILVSPGRTPLPRLPPAAPMEVSTRPDLRQDLYGIIVDACSQDPARMFAATQRLQVVEKEQGAFDAIHWIGADKRFPVNVREMAMIRLKNEAVNHWRSRSLLTDAQKADIRARCMTFMDEPTDSLFSMNVIVMTKIARIDFPLKWPDLVTKLVENITLNNGVRLTTNAPDPGSTLVLRRSLRALHGVIKEFSTMKMPSAVKTMTDLEAFLPDLLMGLWEQYTAFFQQLLHPQSLGSQQLSEDLEIAHLSYKCLSKMAVWRWGRPVSANNPDSKMEAYLAKVIQYSAAQVQALSGVRMRLIMALRESHPSALMGATFADNTNPAVAHAMELLTRHVMVFGKVFRRLSQLRKDKFALHPSTAPLISYYWSLVVGSAGSPPFNTADSPNALFPVRLLVQCLFLFREVMAEWSILAARSIAPNAQELFSPELVVESVRLLVDRFLPLQEEDLRRLQSDPEEWINAEESDSEAWEFELRPCAERVLMTFVTNFANTAKPLLLSMFAEVTASEAMDMPSILRKEAVYCAVGRSVHHLKTDIPFEQWLSDHLVKEAQQSAPEYIVIKRRIAWLIGKWVSYEAVPAPSPLMWQVLLHLLQDPVGGSVIVKLTATISIKECVDTTGFDSKVFEPYLPGVLSALVNLISECDTVESKRRVTRTLSYVIERAGPMVSNFATDICNTLPGLWSNAVAEQHDVLKADLITIATKLVAATKAQSMELWFIIVPLIQQGLQPQARNQLDEDALDLWITALRNATTAVSSNGTPNLLQLFPSAITLLNENLDLLGKVLDVVEGYLFLNAAEILQVHAVALLQGFNKVFDTAVQTNVVDLLNTVQVMMRLSPAPLWIPAFHQSGLFWNLLKALISDKGRAALLTLHLYVFARMLVMDSPLFVALMNETAKAQNIVVEQLYDDLLDQWWKKFDAVSEPYYRKLFAMGIACLVSSGNPVVLQRLTGEIFNLWLDVLCELEEAWKQPSRSPDEPHPLYQREDDENWSSVKIPVGAEGTLEEQRRKHLEAQDPVKTQMLGPFIRQKLNEAAGACLGGPAAFQSDYISKASENVKKELWKLLGVNV